MGKYRTSNAKSKAIIDRVEVTSDTLTRRGGLSLFVRYLRGIGLFPQLETFFGSMRRSRKGQPIGEIFKQLFCFFCGRHQPASGSFRFSGPRCRLCRGDRDRAGQHAFFPCGEAVFSKLLVAAVLFVPAFAAALVFVETSPASPGCGGSGRRHHSHGQRQGPAASRGSAHLQEGLRFSAAADELGRLCG